MRRPSKSQQYYQSIKDDRSLWKSEQPQVCMLCGEPDKWPGLQIHEISRRSRSPNNWGWRCNYVLLCQQHHNEVDSWPFHHQLGLKLLRDPSNYDLDKWIEISGFINICQAEVDAARDSFFRDLHQNIAHQALRF